MEVHNSKNSVQHCIAKHIVLKLYITLLLLFMNGVCSTVLRLRATGCSREGLPPNFVSNTDKQI